MKEQTDEEAALHYIIDKFDPKLILKEDPQIGIDRLKEWILPIREKILSYKMQWRVKVDDLNSSFKEKALQEIRSGLEWIPFLKTGYKVDGDENSYMIRCFDEQEYHLNHWKGLARFNSPSDSLRGLSLYTTAFNEYLTWEIACIAGFSQAIGETTLAVLNNKAFHDVLENPYKEILPLPVKEKICSIQQISKNALQASDFITQFFKEKNQDNLSAEKAQEEFFARLDQDSFEEAFLLSCIIGEMYGAASKYIIEKLAEDKLILKKSNASWAFSNNYLETDTFLTAFPNMLKKLSADGKEKIQELQTAKIEELMSRFGKEEAAVSCVLDRIRRMKELALRKDATLASFLTIGFRKKFWKRENFLSFLQREGVLGHHCT